MNPYHLAGLLIALLVVCILVIKQWKSFPANSGEIVSVAVADTEVGKFSAPLASQTSAENASAVVRAPEGNVNRKTKFGHVVIPGKHGRGTREVVLLGMDS